MTGIESIAPRLALLIPRLASDHDGEIVATAAAIDRTLKSAGCDWHDLASVVSSPPAASTRHRADRQGPPIWESLDRFSQLEWLHALDEWDGLSDWESGFVTSIIRSTRAGWRLTAKQRAVINRLLASAAAAGVTP